jgi:hypothetical protein
MTKPWPMRAGSGVTAAIEYLWKEMESLLLQQMTRG